MKTYLPICIVFVATLNLQAQTNISMASNLDYEQSLSSLWGYTQEDGHEYALVGTVTGLSIVDLSNPYLPEELFFIPGPESTWREIKTYQHYAYVSNENGGGVMIVNLENLPLSIDTVWFRGDSLYPLHTAHTLFIDEAGILYLFGYNIVSGFHGAYVADLSTNPLAPVRLGAHDDFYIHDGFVRNDTLWAAETDQGRFHIYDVSDKSHFVSMGYAATPTAATHNVEPDASGQYAFTTDEAWFGEITAYNISDMADIQETDRVKHGDIELAIPHNVHVKGTYLVASHYSEGVVIIDAQKPEVLVETGHYDTSPFDAGGIIEGAWEAYPYFPSGLIIVSDIQAGLFVLEPLYLEAAFLDGVVLDDVSGAHIAGASVTLVGTETEGLSEVDGSFALGVWPAGTYEVMVSKEGCLSTTVSGVLLTAGETAVVEVLLDCGTVSLPSQPACTEWQVQYLSGSNQIFLQTPCTRPDIERVVVFGLNGQCVGSYALQEQNSLFIPAPSAPGWYLISLGQGITPSHILVY